MQLFEDKADLITGADLGIGRADFYKVCRSVFHYYTNR